MYYMTMFEWKPEYSVGYTQIDEQHKRLFEFANELHNAMANGKGKEILRKTLANLISYTKAHFATEERLMQTHKYPEYAAHKAFHDALTAKVMSFAKEFEGRPRRPVDRRVAVPQGLADASYRPDRPEDRGVPQIQSRLNSHRCHSPARDRL